MCVFSYDAYNYILMCPMYDMIMSLFIFVLNLVSK